MKREQLLRLLRAEAKRLELDFRLDKVAGKGSHYRVKLGKYISTIQSGDLTLLQVKRSVRIWGLIRQMMKRNYSFVVELEPDPDGGVLATFPDVRGAIAHGADENEALSQARTALAVALFGYLKDDRRLPRPTKRLGQQIAPHATDILKIAVVEGWLESGMSKTDFARLLGVDEKEARRILDPDAATKADRLEEALGLLGRKLHIAVEAA